MGGREPEQLGSLSQHLECSPLQGNSFYAAPITALCPLPPAMEETPHQQRRGRGALPRPRHQATTAQGTGWKQWQGSLQMCSKNPSTEHGPAQGPATSHRHSQSPSNDSRLQHGSQQSSSNPGAVARCWA